MEAAKEVRQGGRCRLAQGVGNPCLPLAQAGVTVSVERGWGRTFLKSSQC
jgi:hypothetical protein